MGMMRTRLCGHRPRLTTRNLAPIVPGRLLGVRALGSIGMGHKLPPFSALPPSQSQN